MKVVQKALAQLSLILTLASGTLFLTGCGTTSSGGGAVGTNNIESLTAAANGGDGDAALKLGGIYMNGHGAPKNAIEAETWYKKAAELFQKK